MFAIDSLKLDESHYSFVVSTVNLTRVPVLFELISIYPPRASQSIFAVLRPIPIPCVSLLGSSVIKEKVSNSVDILAISIPQP
jgi:hypothetical protein